MIESIKIFLLAIVVAFLQVFVLQQVDLGFWLHPMPYLFIFLIIPLDFNSFGNLFIAFIFGSLIDFLSGSFGSHAASCVMMIFAKKYIDEKFIDFQSLQLQGENYLNLYSKGWIIFVYYALTLIFIHHLTFFSLDFFDFKQITQIILSTIVSTFTTFLFILLYKHVFNK